MILHTVILVSAAGCATSGISSISVGTAERDSNDSHKLEEKKAPNQFGWDDSNCAHITADGQCAHKTGASIMDTQTPNTNWNSPEKVDSFSGGIYI